MKATSLAAAAVMAGLLFASTAPVAWAQGALSTPVAPMAPVTPVAITLPPSAGQPLSLGQALQSARTSDPKYQSALREYEASREFRISGKAAKSMDVTLSGGYSRNLLEQRAGAFSRDSAYSASNVGVQLRQPVYAPELDARARAGEARSLQGEAVLAQREVELVTRLVDAYTQVDVLRGQLGATDSLIQALDQQVRAAGRLIQHGEGTKTDALEASSRLLLARSQRIEVQDALRDAAQRLAVVVTGGTVVASPYRLRPGFVALPLDPPALAEWEARLLDTSPILRARRHAAEVARAEAERVDASRKARVDVVVGVARNDSDSVNTVNQVNTQGSLGVQLTLPLYDGGKIDSAARQAIAQTAQAEADLLDAQTTLLADVRQAYSQVLSTAGRVEALGAARDAATQQVEATRQSVKGGIRVTLDVLNAENQLYEVERDLARARAEHVRAWVKLRSTTGVLAEADVQRLDAMFEPANR